jgi:hypothetical protein
MPSASLRPAVLRAARAGSGTILSRASPRQHEMRMSRLSPVPTAWHALSGLSSSAARLLSRAAPAAPHAAGNGEARRPNHMRQHLPSVRQISAGAGPQEGRSIFDHDEDDGTTSCTGASACAVGPGTLFEAHLSRPQARMRA